MITSCRHLSSLFPSAGVDRLWRSAVVSNAAKGCLRARSRGSVRNMSGEKDASSDTGRTKKLNALAPVRRPVSVQSSSSGVSSGLRSSHGSLGQALRYMSSASDSRDFAPETEPTTDNAGLLNSASVDILEQASITSAHDSPQSQLNKGLEEGTILNSDLIENTGGSSVIGRHYISVEEMCREIELDDFQQRDLQRQVEDLVSRRQIEREAGVKLTFPFSKPDASILIEGASIENVMKASEKIHDIIEEAVKSRNLDYSHFVSLPLAGNEELVEKLIKFQDSILGDASLGDNGDCDGGLDVDCLDDKELHSENASVAVKLKALENEKHVKLELCAKHTEKSDLKQLRASKASDLGIDGSIFIKPKTFHLTVLMLKLYNKDRIASATEVLQKISSKVVDALDNRPISIKLRGLACMGGSPGKAHVVYAPVEEIGGEGRLLNACRVIIDAYIEAGLVLKEDARQTLKLHATVMNARHRKRMHYQGRSKNFDSFDARGIFKKYGSEEWGEYLIQEAHLSQRFKFDENGYYHCCSSITFPPNMHLD